MQAWYAKPALRDHVQGPLAAGQSPLAWDSVDSIYGSEVVAMGRKGACPLWARELPTAGLQGRGAWAT